MHPHKSVYKCVVVPQEPLRQTTKSLQIAKYALITVNIPSSAYGPLNRNVLKVGFYTNYTNDRDLYVAFPQK